MTTSMMKRLRKSQPVHRITLQYGSPQPWLLTLTVPKPAPYHLPALATITNTQKDQHQVIKDTAQSPLWTITNTLITKIITNTLITKIITDTMIGGHLNTPERRRKRIQIPAITKGTGIQHPR